MATTTVYPISDVTSAWEDGTSAAPNHWQDIDNDPAVGQPDADSVATDTIDQVDEWNLGATPAGTSEVTAVTVNFYVIITDASGTASIEVDLRHTSSTVSLGTRTITITEAGGSGVGANHPESWTGLTLTKAQADSLSVRVTLKATGS